MSLGKIKWRIPDISLHVITGVKWLFIYLLYYGRNEDLHRLTVNKTGRK